MDPDNKFILTTFVDPHLFWLVNCMELSKIRHKISKLLQEQRNDSSKTQELKVGDMVIAKDRGKYYRGIMYSNEESTNCLCWLIDYGRFIEAIDVWKMPAELRKVPPLAFQACLKDTVYVKETFTIDNCGQLDIQKTPSLHAPPNCREASSGLLKSSKFVKFRMDYEENCIKFGDVLYFDEDGNELSLIDKLTVNNIVMKDAELFKSIKSSLSNNLEKNISLIFSINRKDKFLSENTNDPIRKGKELAMKYSSDFYSDEHVSTLQPRKRKDSSGSSVRSIEFSQMSLTGSTSEDLQEERGETKESPPQGVTSGFQKQETAKTKLPNHVVLMPHSGYITTMKESATTTTYSARRSSKSSDSSKKEPKDTPFNAKLAAGNVEDTSLSSSSEISHLTTENEEVKDLSISDGSENTSLTKDTNTEKSDKTYCLKPVCTCRQCDLWTHKEDSYKPEEFSKKTPIRVAEVPNKRLFKKTCEEYNQKVTSVTSLNYKSMSKIQKQTVAQLLVHGESLPKAIKPVSSVNFHQSIHSNLTELQYKEAKKIQLYSWPAIFRNQNVFMINRPYTGKTIAYLPVIATFLLEKEERYDFLKNNGGPIAVILCKNTNKCHDISILCRKLVKGLRVKVSNISYPLNHVNVNNTDLLITTPTIAEEMLKTRIMNFKNLCHFVLEDGDDILNDYEEEMNKIFALMQDVLSHRMSSKSMQLIICSNYWTNKIEKLLKSLSDVPVVCVANHLEAALYGRMKFSMKFMTATNKLMELTDSLIEVWTIHKCVVVCTNDEITEIKEYLMLKGINTTAISEDLSKAELLFLEESWTASKGDSYTVLVTTDTLLQAELSITCAFVLIHYSLPRYWSKFMKRFSCMLENYRSPLETTKEVCQSVVFCDETTETQMVKFFSYINMTGLKSQLPEKLQLYSQGLIEKEEERKVQINTRLCDNLKLFGVCKNVRCPKRHILSKEIDSSDETGRIKFVILEVLDVAYYSIGIIKDNINPVQLSQEITNKLTDTLIADKMKKISRPVLGHFYTYSYTEMDQRVLCRCELIGVDDDEVKIRLIDKGSIVKTTEASLYKLPDRFKPEKIPPVALEAYLADCIPPFRDENFSPHAFNYHRKLLEEIDWRSMTFTANVCLRLRHTVWLRDVCEEKVLSEQTIEGFQLSLEVVRKKFAVVDQIQTERLYKLCKAANIQCPTPRQPKEVRKRVEEEKQVKPQWAHLDADNVNEVIFSSAVSPAEIYFRIDKYNNLLYRLQKEIQQAIKKFSYPKLNKVEPGLIYLAEDKDGNSEYARAKVLQLQDDKALCFFVDYGDEMNVPLNKLKPITNALIQKLPFQSIQCRLHGLAPVTDCWEPDALNCLYEYAFEPHTDIFRSLYVKVCEKERIPNSEQRRYSVLLKDGFGINNILINNLLIDCGLAVSNGERIEDIKLPELKEMESEDEDEEEVEDINDKDDPFDDEELELFVEDPELFIRNYFTMRQEDSTSTTKRELLPMIAVPPVDYYTPDVYWHQLERVVKLSIRLVDASDYHLTLIKSRTISFSCQQGGKRYQLKLMLYDLVESMQHSAFGSDIRVTLVKKKVFEWPRLIISKERVRNIHFETSMIQVEDENTKVLELPKFDEELYEDSDRYVFTGFSDLDSDLDLEVEKELD